jgi:hypothetical protein
METGLACEAPQSAWDRVAACLALDREQSALFCLLNRWWKSTTEVTAGERGAQPKGTGPRCTASRLRVSPHSQPRLVASTLQQNAHRHARKQLATPHQSPHPARTPSSQAFSHERRLLAEAALEAPENLELQDGVASRLARINAAYLVGWATRLRSWQQGGVPVYQGRAFCRPLGSIPDAHGLRA